MVEPLSPVESTGDSIAHALREDILAGRLSGGDRLVEEALAKQFGVSRIPVREALTRLQSEGFVRIVRHKGATVSETMLTDSRELLQIRRGLEILAAQLAAQNRGGTVAAELAEVADDEATTDDHSPFHELVAAASGNRQLMELLASVNRRVQWGLGHNPVASIGDHRILAMAILSGSAVQAGYLMDEHLQRDERYFAEKFEHDTDE
ncbi:GntR family transcriptional regulator [Mycolicibacterium cosmeticum]|uniref:Transcriptional regulator n=1 Tax=Mycolicibacterium cosmeticum TaxID=258533 RepID=W9B5G0_MYCCO|nr:GntR family transcriptional regulator [Mycolicibacterium cosmeticum]TLH81595.1 GntR family transcriptional regulator [Mycolicibacterium cosmeticum]CDO10257.1 transcriptional regulator [Mycolicibacterium cosmeticum]